MTYAAEFRMFRHTPELCRAPDYARAFLYAASQGWLPPGDLSDGGPAIDSTADYANEKLAARRAFLRLITSTPEDPAEPADAVDMIAALENAPDSWLRTSHTWPFVEKLGRARDDLPQEAADRLTKVSERILRLEGQGR